MYNSFSLRTTFIKNKIMVYYLLSKFCRNMKTCKGPCGKEKHRSEFQKDKGTSDGCYAYCRVCNNARMKKKRQDATYRKREREQQNVYRITPAAKQRRRDIYAASNATEHGNLLTRLKKSFGALQRLRGHHSQPRPFWLY